jgi:hypothetical protein
VGFLVMAPEHGETFETEGFGVAWAVGSPGV